MRFPVIYMLGLMAALSPGAAAQTNEPDVEVFLGPSYFRDSSGDDGFGGQANVGINFTERFGIAVDLGAQFPTGLRFYQAMVGPRFVFRKDGWTPFVHALAGVWHLNGGASGGSETGLALGLGGGLDVPIGGRFAVRVLQAEYLPTQVSGRWFHNGRVGTGIVVRFGD